jgi:hypothetical protein
VPRHHVVPQLMLRRFADDAERIVMADRDPPHRTVTTKVRTAAAENGFYRIDADDVADGHRDGHDPELVEKALSGVEGAAAGPLVDLIAGRFPSLEDRYRIALLVALQAVRGQGFRDEMERIATLAARTHLQATVTDDRIRGWLADKGQPVGPDDVEAFREEMLRDDGWSLRMSHSYAVQESLRFGMEVIQPRLYFSAWEVWTFDGPVLLTSDAPVAPWSPPRPDGLPVGIADAQHVYLPMDRSTVLVVTDRPQDLTEDRAVRQTSPALAGRVNRAVASGAHRWLYHHPDDRPLDGLRVGPRQRWMTEQAVRDHDSDGTVTVRGMYVRRPVPPSGGEGGTGG